MAEPKSCRHCGCTDEHSCEGGCFWVLPDVCAVCAIRLLQAAGVESFELECALDEHRKMLAIAAGEEQPRILQPGIDF